MKYSGLNSKQFEVKLSELSTFVKEVPERLYKEFESEAKQHSPHDKDIPVLLGAVLSNSDYLITLDKKHFLNNPRLSPALFNFKNASKKAPRPVAGSNIKSASLATYETIASATQAGVQN